MALDSLKAQLLLLSFNERMLLREWFFTLSHAQGEPPEAPSNPCCERLMYYLQEGEVALHYSPRHRDYGIAVLDGGSSVIRIGYCPWCGTRFPPSLAAEWFRRLEELGLEVGDAEIPREMMSEQWWLTEFPQLPGGNRAEDV